MYQWIKKIVLTLFSSHSEKVNQPNLKTKYMPYKGAYFFTHVPKTGGTSFIVFLDRFFPAKVIFPDQLWTEIGDFEQVDKQSYNLIRGHFGGCTADLFTDKEIRSLTILRDPVKLAYSTYEYVRREKNTALHELVLAEEMSFETFLTHAKTKHLVTNRMVHNLVFGYKYDESVKHMDVNDATFTKFRKLINKGQEKLNDENRLDIAISFLQQSLWFGVLENYDDAIRLLCYKMTWPPQGQSQRLNINKIKPVITDKAKNIALSLNKLDSALYEFATESFSREFAKMKLELGISSHIDAKQLDRLLDESYQDNYTAKYNFELPKSIDYDCSEILLGGQWHRREWNPLSKSYFRWTGPGESSYIDFWIYPQKCLIKISIVDAINSNILDQISIDINGTKKKYKQKGRGKSRVFYIACQSGDIKRNGLLRINFHSQNLQSHKNHFSSDDSRIVGFALSTVQISQLD